MSSSGYDDYECSCCGKELSVLNVRSCCDVVLCRDCFKYEECSCKKMKCSSCNLVKIISDKSKCTKCGGVLCYNCVGGCLKCKK